MPVKIVRDLRSMFGPARDQLDRPTCLGFAASDYHAGIRDGWTPLSCEYVFYHAQRRDGRSPHVGATLGATFDALREDGQPVESDWPYVKTLPSDVKAWLPPKKPLNLFRCSGERKTITFGEIISLLSIDQPALVLMTLSDSFYTPDSDGLVTAPVGERPDPARRHAVVAVAHGTLTSERVVLLRNSWGADWGIGGHAWLTESFLGPRLTRVATFTRSTDVSAH